jgi:hypothetical protein
MAITTSRALGRLLFLVAVALLAVATTATGARAQMRAVAPTADDQAEMRAILERWMAAQQDTPCTEQCYLLSRLSLTGKVGETRSFTLRGEVLAKDKQKIPLFGEPSAVRLDDVTLDGVPATLGFEGDSYFFLAPPRAFVLRGKLTLSGDQALTVAGPVNAFDADLASGRVVEGEKLSGLSHQTLHFDPMTPESRSKTPSVFRLSRALRIGKELTFVYRITVSQSDDVGSVRLPLRYGEKVREVSGSVGWTADGDLVLPIAGKEADVTVTGTLPKLGSFTPDERGAYEWWLVESDPDHRVALEGQGKLVDNGQSPIPATMPSARTVLLQRGERFEVTSLSLVQGEVLAGVARRESRIVILTGRGEMVGEEKIDFDNNGLDLLSIDPGGRPIFLASDGVAQRILHSGDDRTHVLVPIARGRHELRMQTLAERGIGFFGGVLSVPMPGHALTASAVDVTVGVPGNVVPLAFFGGDRVRWGLARGDLLAVLAGALAAAFAFRTWRTRALGAVVTGGLWFVAHDAFLAAAALLVVVGAIFLASRFLRGNVLLAVGGLTVAAGIFAGSSIIGAVGEPQRDLFIGSAEATIPWAQHASSPREDAAGLDRGGATPVSLSLPVADTYVATSRQLVSKERPFTPRLVYVTHAVLLALELAWVAILALLVYAHRAQLVALWPIVKGRLARRPEPPAPAPERGW